MLLGINIDHVATLRNARNTIYPSPLQAALLAETYGADQITLHLREDRRHIRDHDVIAIRQAIQTRMNLEMALTDEMLVHALKVKPYNVCIVPEKREELTTEGGLDVISQQERIQHFIDEFNKNSIRVSLFIDADPEQIQAAHEVGATAVELHTGAYAQMFETGNHHQELLKLEEGALLASDLGLAIHAGHGLTHFNVAPIARIGSITELNIGHAIIAQALFLGLPESIKQMRQIIFQARSIPY